MKTHVHVVFLLFHFVQLFSPNEIPGFYRHRPGYSLGKKVKMHEMKNEKNYNNVGFCIPNI